MLSNSNLLALEKRRQVPSLVMFNKIKYNLVKIPLPAYIEHALRNRNTIPFSRIDSHRYTFFCRTARLWNSLPPDLCTSPDLSSFRAGQLPYLNTRCSFSLFIILTNLLWCGEPVECAIQHSVLRTISESYS